MSSSLTINEAKTDEEILACHPTIVEVLRPHLKDADSYLAQVRRQRQNDGYRLMFIRDPTGRVVSILGFRVSECLYLGKNLYIDDFATLSTARGVGYGDALMKWAIGYAEQLDCDNVRLDSGYGRHDAHRFYLNHGFNMIAHHFVQQLKK